MSAAITDLLTQATVNSRPSPTTVSSIRAAAGSTLQCLALTGWATGTAVHFITYKIDTSGNKIAGSQLDWKGVVSGTTLTNLTLKAGTDTGSAIGDIVEAAPTAAYANDLYSWGSAHANQDGSLITSAVQTALNLGTGALNGWNVLAYTPNTVTYNGNRSYSLVFNSQDLTGTLSAGTRLRTTRTVAAPNQSASLNGSTQYFNKTSPAGMTFTNNFCVSVWIKPTAYPTSNAGLVTRYNGTSGWVLTFNTDGTVKLQGFNAGSTNQSAVNTSQSLPLNKWTHIFAQLDMATFTATTTTSYIMLDGVDVPCTVTRGGTNPTALVQAGNLEIGSLNGGTQLFTGKIAQPAVFNAKVLQANVPPMISQSLVGTETSLISAYTLSNSTTDLNTGNANNLTANGSATTTNADSPYGNQADGSISTTLDYSIIQSASFSTNTTLVVQVPEGCSIPTTGGVTSVVYSSNKAPYGMPLQREKWQILSLYRIQTTATPTVNQFIQFNNEQLNIPIGSWHLRYQMAMFVSSTSTTDSLYWTLGLASTSTVAAGAEDDITMSGRIQCVSTGNNHFAQPMFQKSISLAAATIYYFYINRSNSGTVSPGQDADNGPAYILVENAFL